MGSCFPPTAGQILPNSVSSDLPSYGVYVSHCLDPPSTVTISETLDPNYLLTMLNYMSCMGHTCVLWQPATECGQVCREQGHPLPGAL